MAKSNLRAGTCSQCGALLEGTPAVIEKHFRTCEATQRVCRDAKPGKTEQTYYRILVKDRYSADYWLMLEVRSDAMLEKLDQFLRDIWLECCGHLSVFRIGKDRYESDPPDLDDPFHAWETPSFSLRVRIGDVLSTGDKADYTYDYGSSTDLTLRVITVRKGARRTKAVTLLARNKAPAFQCATCGSRQAAAVCVGCGGAGSAGGAGEGMLCEACAKTHPCGEHMQLPLVNSPRTGVCAYTGSLEIDAPWIKDMEESAETPNAPWLKDMEERAETPDIPLQKKMDGMPDVTEVLRGASLSGAIHEFPKRKGSERSDPVLDALLTSFPGIDPDLLDKLVDRFHNMTPAEMAALEKANNRMFGQLWIALPENHDIRSLLGARSEANLMAMSIKHHISVNKRSRAFLADELARQYQALPASALSYVDPILFEYWNDVLDSGGMLVMQDVKDEPKDQIQMLMALGLLFPFRVQGRKVLVAPIEHLKQFPKRLRKRLHATCLANSENREQLLALIEFHGMIPLAEYLEDASDMLGEPVTEELFRLLFSEGIPSTRLEAMGIVLPIDGIRQVVRPDLENPFALWEVQQKLTLVRRRHSDVSKPECEDQMRQLDAEIAALLDLLRREPGVVEPEKALGSYCDAIRRGVSEPTARQEWLDGVSGASPFVRQRVERMLDKITEMLPRYELKGYSRAEVNLVLSKSKGPEKPTE